jgi:hypothetical protein
MDLRRLVNSAGETHLSDRPHRTMNYAARWARWPAVSGLGVEGVTGESLTPFPFTSAATS